MPTVTVNGKTFDFPEKKENRQSSSDKIAEVALKEHNIKRRLHHDTCDLTWDRDLARGAEEWARYLLQKNKGQLQHSQSDEYGENLYQSMSTLLPNEEHAVKTAIEKWYNEIDSYNFNRQGRPQAGTGHFTQLIWKSTTRVGLGCAKGEVGGWNVVIVVGRYKEPGNFVGRDEENVMPLAL